MAVEHPQPADLPNQIGLGLAVCLTAVAGYVDATAFVRFGGLYVSFMSGESTRIAALPALGQGGAAALAAGVVALFVMGAFAGRLLHEAAGAWRRPALLSLTAALLTLATLAGAWPVRPDLAQGALGVAVAAMTLSMGVMNAVLKRVGETTVAATYVTGVLFHLGQALADRAMGRGAPWAVYLLTWLGLVLGAAIGALATAHMGLAALVLPATFTALLAVLAGGLVRRAQAVRSL